MNINKLQCHRIIILRCVCARSFVCRHTWVRVAAIEDPHVLMESPALTVIWAHHATQLGKFLINTQQQCGEKKSSKRYKCRVVLWSRNSLRCCWEINSQRREQNECDGFEWNGPKGETCVCRYCATAKTKANGLWNCVSLQHGMRKKHKQIGETIVITLARFRGGRCVQMWANKRSRYGQWVNERVRERERE